MIRRRPFRRPPRPPLRRPGVRPPSHPLPERARQALVRANRLMEEGAFLEAATAFSRLSGRARSAGMLLRAGELALRAARAYLAAGDTPAALEWARKGLRALVRGGRAGRVPRVLSRISGELRDKGYTAEADQLEEDVAQALERFGLSFDASVQRPLPIAGDHDAPARGSLPTRCAGCGAALVPDEVEWHDAHTAECIYCGTLAKAG